MAFQSEYKIIFGHFTVCFFFMNLRLKDIVYQAVLQEKQMREFSP